MDTYPTRWMDFCWNFQQIENFQSYIPRVRFQVEKFERRRAAKGENRIFTRGGGGYLRLTVFRISNNAYKLISTYSRVADYTVRQSPNPQTTIRIITRECVDRASTWFPPIFSWISRIVFPRFPNWENSYEFHASKPILIHNLKLRCYEIISSNLIKLLHRFQFEFIHLRIRFWWLNEKNHESINYNVSTNLISEV